MADSMQKWVATGKRLHVEDDGAMKRVTLFIVKEQDLARDFQALEKTRADHRAHVQKQIYWFSSALDQIKIKLEEKVNFNEKHAKAVLQHMLETFEGRLASFKVTMRGEFDRLESEEAQLVRDVESVEMNLDVYTASDSALKAEEQFEEDLVQANARHRNAMRLNEDVAHKAAIGEVDRELASLGRFGDWDPRDHDAFVRVWNSTLAGAVVVHKVVHHDDDIAPSDPETSAELEALHPGKATLSYEVQLTPAQRTQLLKKMEFTVLGKSKDDLLEHMDWYAKQLALAAKKKQLLGDWRRAQATRRRLLTEKAVEEVEAEEEDPVLDEDQLAKEEARVRKQEEQRVCAQQRAAKWRADKKHEEERAVAEKARLTEQELRDAAEERKKRQNQLQSQIAVWKETAGVKKPSAHSDEPPSPRRTDPAELKRRQEKDLELAKQRKEKMTMASAKKTERDRKLSDLMSAAPEPVVERDPARLLSATKASQAAKVYGEDLDAAERKRSTAGAHSGTVAMSGRDLQFAGRAKPTWMRPPN